MDSGEPGAASDLSSLVWRLRRANFRIDTRQFLTAHELLIGLAARGQAADDVDRLVSYLAPVFCTSEEEQDRFGPEVRAWLSAEKAPLAPPQTSAPSHVAPAPDPFAQWRRFRWVAIAVVSAALIAAAVVAAHYFRPAPTPSRTEVTEQPVVPPAGAASAIAVRRVDVRFEVSSGSSNRSWLTIAVAGSVAAAVVLATLWLLARARRLLALRSFPERGDPELAMLVPPENEVSRLPEADIARLATALRRPHTETSGDLDVALSVDETARHGGFFRPRFASRRGSPEYLALVSRRGANDHQARAFDALMDPLQKRDVVLDRYSFHDDPRVCYADDSGQPHRLSGLLSRHHRATLIVCAEASAAFDHTTGEMAPWVETTAMLRRRVYLTPESPYRWTQSEFDLIEAGLVVLPANDVGWRALLDLDQSWRAESFFPAPYTRGFPDVIGTDELRWLDRIEPPAATVRKVIRQVKEYLGAEGFTWMCACAVYPEVSWPLTLGVAGPAPDLTLLPMLSRLPWFRHGFMPDWLRRNLVRQLPPAAAGRLKRTLETFLKDFVERESSAYGARRAPALLVGRWVGPLDLLGVAKPDSPLRDRVFIGFMSGANPDPEVFVAPKRWSRLFRTSPAEFESAADARARAQLSWWQRSKSWILTLKTFHPTLARLAVSAALGLLASAAVWGSGQPVQVPSSMTLVFVPGGPVGMGSRESDPSARPDERPLTDLDVPPYFIGEDEVTVADYVACVRERACAPGDSRTLQGLRNLPVRYLSWEEAMDYANWLTAKLQSRSEVFNQYTQGRDSWFVTLPSEPEWEKAARGDDARVFPWGSQTDTSRAVYQTTSGLSQPGSFPGGEAAYGAQDMAGNVAEWTRSQYKPYPYQSEGTESVSQNGSAQLVVRGGSFASTAPDVRAAARRAVLDSDRSAEIGFRIAVSTRRPVTMAARDSVVPPPIPPRPPYRQSVQLLVTRYAAVFDKAANQRSAEMQGLWTSRLPSDLLSTLRACPQPRVNVRLVNAVEPMATVQQTYSCPSNPGDRVSTTTHQWKLDTSSGAPLIVSRTVVNTPPRSESGSGGAPLSLDEINRNSPLQPVFFANGSAVLSAEAKRVLDQNAAVLRTYSTWTITIEGHCDELGSAEENLAMGERRAIAARTYLIMVGIAPERLRTVSYGKEFPFDPGNTEQARAENRRAHFVITAK